MADAFTPVLQHLESACLKHGESETTTPFVTLAYAQALDGSIAGAIGKPLRLSGSDSMLMTHRLRAWHDSIVVGVSTVVADDPSLTVRLCSGANPLPVILDSTLRTPPECKLLCEPACRRPVIATTLAGPAAAERQRLLQQAGATILLCEREPGSHRVDLRDALERLKQTHGASRVMIEGGASVISSLLQIDSNTLLTSGMPLVSAINVTVAPTLIGGVRAVQSLLPQAAYTFPRLASPVYVRAGDDFIVHGTLCHDGPRLKL